MGGIKTTITIDERVWKELDEKARHEGFSGVPALVRHLAVKELRKRTGQDTDRKIIEVPVDNYGEIEAYVSEKKFGRIESFVTYAMACHMKQFKLTPAQKERAEKSIG